jgi:hypothetical protein
MADLEESWLLYSPNTSAGRLQTEAALRFFVHGLLEISISIDREPDDPGPLRISFRLPIDTCPNAGKFFMSRLKPNVPV